jgi:hypothetical protein
LVGLCLYVYTIRSGLQVERVEMRFLSISFQGNGYNRDRANPIIPLVLGPSGVESDNDNGFPLLPAADCHVRMSMWRRGEQYGGGEESWGVSVNKDDGFY